VGQALIRSRKMFIRYGKLKSGVRHLKHEYISITRWLIARWFSDQSGQPIIFEGDGKDICGAERFGGDQ